MTTAHEADKKARVERARETGLFRYSLVQELLEPGLSQAERGWRARELAGRYHPRVGQVRLFGAREFGAAAAGLAMVQGKRGGWLWRRRCHSGSGPTPVAPMEPAVK